MKIGIINELGGHLTELLMLSQAMEGQEVFFVTSVTDRRFGARVHYQIDLHPKQFGMVPLTVGRVLNLIWQSWKILRKEKPDVLISTGAEICLPAFWLSRVLGIKTIFIESVTRVDEPTITGRLAYPVSDVFFVQQPEMLRRYGRRARYEGGGDVILVSTGHFVTFYRLLDEMDRIASVIEEEVQIQIPGVRYRPRHATHVEHIEEMRPYLKKARLVVTHGAMTLVECLEEGVPVICVPRRKQYQEHINDHQLTFANRLAQRYGFPLVEDVSRLEGLVAQDWPAVRYDYGPRHRLAAALRSQLDVWRSGRTTDKAGAADSF